MTAIPPYPTLTRLVARNLGCDGAALIASLGAAGVADLADVLAFRQAHLHVPVRWPDEAYMRWRYRWDDAAPGFGPLWLLRREGQLLAMLGLETLLCLHEGTVLEGVRGMDLLVRPDLLETGLGVWLNATLVERHTFALAMGANANSHGIVSRLFRPLRPRRTYTHPLDLGPFMARHWPRWRTVSAAARPAANAGLALRRRWLLHSAMPRQARVEVRPVERLDADCIPAPALRAARAVHVCRDATHLNRRLLENPRRGAQIRVARAGGRLLGYVATATATDPGGRTETHVVDWQCTDAPAFRVLLADTVRVARQARHSCVRVVLQDAEEQQLAVSCGFHAARDDDGRIAGVQSRDSALADRLAQARWKLTDATDDADGF